MKLTVHIDHKDTRKPGHFKLKISDNASFDTNRGFQLDIAQSPLVFNAEGAKLETNEFNLKLLSSGADISFGSADIVLTAWGDFPDETDFSFTLAGLSLIHI